MIEKLNSCIPLSLGDLPDKINEIIDVVNKGLCKHPGCSVTDAHTHNPDAGVILYL